MKALTLSLLFVYSLTAADKQIESPIFNRSTLRLVRSKTIEDILREEAAMRAAEETPLLKPDELNTPPQKSRKLQAPAMKSVRTSKRRKRTTPRRAAAPPEIIIGYSEELDSSDEELYRYNPQFPQEPTH